MIQEKVRVDALRHEFGVSAAARMTSTGRIDLPKEFHVKLEPIADTSCEPLDRLCALETARERGIDESDARLVLGMDL
jgi:hypothetical protein